MIGIGALASAAVMAPVLNLLLEANGIGTPAFPRRDAARRAAGNADGLRRERHLRRRLPWNMVAIGAGVGAHDHRSTNG
jgi:uncharacterized oligopeptide transporter (OPT) family protein